MEQSCPKFSISILITYNNSLYTFLYLYNYYIFRTFITMQFSKLGSSMSYAL